MTRKKVGLSSADPVRGDRIRHRSIKEIVGPFGIFNLDWSWMELDVATLKCDSDNRIYAVGVRMETAQYYLVRISAEGTLGDGRADVDIEFGENGFVPIVAEGLTTGRVLQIVSITPNHVTISAEVVNESIVPYLVEVALFRFLLDGQPDVTFGEEGFVVFPQLPEPSRTPLAVTMTTGQQQSGLSTSLGSGLGGRRKEKFIETRRATSDAMGVALADGQLLLVAYKRRVIADKISYLIRVNEDGTLDSSYAGGAGYVRLAFTGNSTNSDYKLSVDSLGRATIVSGTADRSRCLATRFVADGGIDINFGVGGFIQFSSSTGDVQDPAIKIDGNDKAVISVCYRPAGLGPYAVYVYRLDEGGLSDPTFNNGYAVELIPEFPLRAYLATSIDIDEQQRIVLRGRCYDSGPSGSAMVISRCNDQGLDTSFGESGNVVISGMGQIDGSLTIQTGLGVVASDNTFLWRIIP